MMRSPSSTRHPEGTGQNARQLRREMTPAERVLWKHLRNRQLGGHKFRRQHPLGPFVVDFYCPAGRLVVEVDGGIHTGQQERDEERAAYLTGNGYRVVRLRNEEVLQRIEWVLAVLHQAVGGGAAGS
jgi:very-short-patch-repair endonuclease